MSDSTDEREQRAEDDMCLARFEGMADVWAAEVNLIEMIKNVAHVSRLAPKAPDDVREMFIERQIESMDAIARQSFLEGAVRVFDQAAATIERLRAAVKASEGYLLNAKIDLQTGAPKRTAIQTIDGGLKVVRAALTPPPESEGP